MAKLLLKLEELSKKLDDFNSFIYQDSDKIDINNFSIEHYMEQLKNDNQSRSYKEDPNDIRSNENPSLATLNELSGKIGNEFEPLQHSSTNMDPNKKNMNEFLLHLKDEIGKMQNDISSRRYHETNKAHALIKLQTLSALITCHILNVDNNFVNI